MSEFESRLASLEKDYAELRLQLDASKVAITILSSVIETISGQERGLIASGFAFDESKLHTDMTEELRERAIAIDKEVKFMLGGRN